MQTYISIYMHKYLGKIYKEEEADDEEEEEEIHEKATENQWQLLIKNGHQFKSIAIWKFSFFTAYI